MKREHFVTDGRTDRRTDRDSDSLGSLSEPKNGTNEKQHRYAPHPECSNPCRVMAVTTFNKYTAIRNGTMEVKILLPRIVNVTKDVFVKTFISLGNRK